MEIVMELTPTECPHCGVGFTIPSRYCSSLKETGQRFYCPNGHTLSFGEGENDRLRKQINDQSNMIRRRSKEIESLEMANSNKKGQISKLKKKLGKEKQ